MATTTDNKISTTEARERLTAAVANLATEEGWRAWLDLRSSMHDYSWSNLALILMQCPQASLVGGAKNFWKARGRYPMKGTKALRIFAPIIIKKADENGNERGVCIGFRLVPVFDASQTDGEPIPAQPEINRLEGSAPVGLIPGLLAVAAAEGVTVLFDEPASHPEAAGDYSKQDLRIRIAPGLSEAQQAKTLAHELAHHFDLNRTDDTSRSAAEIVAEASAYIVAHAAGMDTSGYSTGYVASWSSGDTEKIKAVAQRIDHVVSAIRKGLGEGWAEAAA